MTSKTVLTICFSIVLICSFGCSLFSPEHDFPSVEKVEWTHPKKPELSKVNFQQVEGGFFLDEKSAETLADNIDELKAYAEKLEVLVETIEEYYER